MKLPPLTQEYWDDNRQRFEAEGTQAPINIDPHTHSFIRKNPQEVGCEHCSVIWIDNGRWIIKDGKITLSSKP